MFSKLGLAGGLAAIVALVVPLVFAGQAVAAKGPPPTVCARPEAGAVATPAQSLYSHNGVLNVTMDYVSSTDDEGRTLYCFVTARGEESPTLRVNPGDTLNITLHNTLPAAPAGAPGEMAMAMDANVCGDATMNPSSVNMHFHGTNTSPTCHSDEVIHTLVNGGETFQYHIHFPKTEPPGLYWYHPHVHGQSEAAVLGGATGAIVVGGLQNLQPVVAGLPERLLVIRDQIVITKKMPGGAVPSWDLSLNYVPISFPANTPAVLNVRPGRRELWRVANTSADTIIDLRLKYDGIDQPLEVVGLDGVPTGSQDGKAPGKVVWLKHILLPTAGRAEFVVTTPPASVQQATLVTDRVDVGPAGDNDPTRTLAVIDHAAGGGADAMPVIPAATARAPAQLFEGLDDAKVTAQRSLYFSEVFEDARKHGAMTMPTAMHPEGGRGAGPNDDGPIQFFITVVGDKPKVFKANIRPAIVTTQGAVEEWTVENRTEENHEFHLHQIHFKLLKRNGVTLKPDQQQYLDTVQIPYWTGQGPYPSVTLKVDFRGAVAGDFVYHCHILEHEDGGMMATIRVLPKAPPARITG